ncbi:MAG: YhbY family RNA-binding protein [Oscillospiraceae bacterium]|jgi:RNA-binding protein|nr:YhbY family RNA-binding protein [Oscillospiraceae bacterium]
MTSKERAVLRAQANRLEAMFHVGKEGVTSAVAAQMLDAFRARELLKGKVLLESSPLPPQLAARELAERTGAEVIQVIGGSMVFFKENPDLHVPAKKTAKSHKKDVKKKPPFDKSKQFKRAKSAQIANHKRSNTPHD